MPEIKTSDICVRLVKDPVLELLVPAWACRSIPIPLIRCGLPCLGVYFFPIKGEAGAEKKIYPPLVRVLLDKQDGRIVEVVQAPLFWLPGNKPDEPIGVYPGKGLKGIPVGQADALYQKYYNLCDKILEEMKAKPISKCSSFIPWKQSYDQIKEDGLDCYYNLLLGLAVTVNGSASGHTEATSGAPRVSRMETMRNDTGSVFNATRFMDELRSLLIEARQEDLVLQLRQVRSNAELSGFTVAIVGEFSRGKSTLINKLLQKDLLPVGDLPTTAMLTKILYGSIDMCRHVKADKTEERFSPTRESLARFVSDPDGNDPEGVLQIEIPNQWLGSNGLSLFDTPGSGDLTGRRVLITVEAIARCDAAIVVLNATMPCSLTELSFINDHVLAKRMPRIAATVSKLDLVPVNERASVIKHIVSKLQQLSPLIEVWVTQGRTDIPEEVRDLVEAAGPSEIQERIVQWSRHPDHLRLRNVHALAQAADVARAFGSIVRTQYDTVSLDTAKRDEKLRKAKVGIEHTFMQWEDLRLVLEGKSIETESWLDSAIRESGNCTTEDLEQVLKRSVNPKIWWEQEFPYALRRRVESLAKELDGRLCLKMEQDRRWLEGEIRQRFNLDGFGNLEMLKKGTSTIVPPTPLPWLRDIERVRTVSRVGAIASSAVGFLLFGPLAIGVTGGLGLWSEHRLRTKVEEQKGELLVPLRGVIDHALLTAAAEVRSRVREWYSVLYANTKQMAVKWQNAQLCAIEASQCTEANQLPRLISLIDENNRLLEHVSQ